MDVDRIINVGLYCHAISNSISLCDTNDVYRHPANPGLKICKRQFLLLSRSRLCYYSVGGA
jgi:hypothetical protein